MFLVVITLSDKVMFSAVFRPSVWVLALLLWSYLVSGQTVSPHNEPLDIPRDGQFVLDATINGMSFDRPIPVSPLTDQAGINGSRNVKQVSNSAKTLILRSTR